MKYKHVTFFLPNGTTLRFSDVGSFELSEVGVASFVYLSASDSLVKRARFKTGDMIGISYCE